MNSLELTLVGYLKPFVTKICDVSVRSHSLQTWEQAKVLNEVFSYRKSWANFGKLG